MPPRLLFVLALLAAGAAAWLVFGSTGDERADTVGAADLPAGEAGDATLRGAGGREGAADARSRSSGTGAGDADAAKAAAAAIGEPHPERVKATLRGVVRGPGGRQIAGARVVLIDADGNRIELTTDTNGWYTFRGTPGRYRVLIDGGRDGVAWLADALLDGGSAGLPLQTQLQQPGGVRARVAGKSGPVVGIVVTLAPPPDAVALAGLPPRELRTDPAGIALFEEVVPGDYLLTATTEAGSTYRVPVTVHPDVVAEARVLVLPLRTITGTVRGGPNGPPVGDAALRLVVNVPGVGEPAEQSWSTDYAGSFRTEVPKGVPVRLEVRAHGYAPTVLQQARFPPSFLRAFLSPSPEPARLDVNLEEGRAVYGVARDKDGRPVPELALALEGQGGFVLGEATTAADGSYRIEHVPMGTATFVLRTPGYSLRARAFVGVPALKDVAFDLVVAPARRVQGTVVGADGRGVAGARVSLHAWSEVDLMRDPASTADAFSDERGWWRMDDVPGGQVLVARATLGDRVSLPVRLEVEAPSPATLTLILQGTGSVRGIVRDRRTELPVAGARVSLHSAAWGSTYGGQATSDAEGRFEARGLAPGPWRVAASADGYLTTEPESATVQLGVPGEVAIALDPGIAFEGVVVDAEDLPIEGAEVFVEWRSRLVQPSHGGTPLAIADAAGRFRLAGYPPGTYALMARIPGTTRLATQVVKEGGTSFRLVLERPKETK